MNIQVDTREKAHAITRILEEFEIQGINYFSSKLYIADYMNLDNPLVFIDRKQNIAEIAQNATAGHKRFKTELERLKQLNAKMYILIEQDTVNRKKIKSLEDIILWKPKFGKIVGEQIYRILASWQYKYNIEFVFCNKRNTGKEIIRLLEK